MTTRSKEGLKELEGVIATVEKTLERLRSRQASASDIYFWEAYGGYYRRLHQANQEGTPIACTGFFIPVELLHALGIANYVAETHGIFTVQGNPELGPVLFDTAESYGMVSDICAPHRAATGITVRGMVPRPWMVVSTATTCDQTLKLYEVLADHYKVPRFLIDTPYGIRSGDLQYGRADIQELISFLEEHSGRRLDQDRLKEVLRISRQCYDYWEKVCELRKAVPAPIGGREVVKDFAIMHTQGGTPEALNYFRARYQEISARVARQEGVVPDEKYRIAWLYVLPQFDLRIADWLQDTFKAVIVMDNFSIANPEVELDPEKPLDFLALKPFKWKFVHWSFSPNAEAEMAQGTARLCREYHCNVAILLSHWSCQQWCGMGSAMKDAITRGVGIPFFTLNADLLDARVCSPEQMRAQLAEFFHSVVGA